MLEEMELSKEQIDQIMKINGEDIENAKSELANVTKERDDARETIKERDKQLEDLKKSTGDVDELKKKIEELQNGNEQSRLEYEANLRKAKRDGIDSELLLRSGSRNNKAILALLDALDDKLDDDAYRKAREDQIKKLQSADDSKFLFDIKSKPSIKGANVGESGDGTPPAITKEQFDKMSYLEKVELFNTDKETYDALSK